MSRRTVFSVRTATLEQPKPLQLVRPLSVARRFSTRGVAVRVFFTCWLIYGLHFATNTVREIYPALSLGDRFSFDVAEYAGLHPDIFEVPGRGVFINSNPGASVIGAIPYLALRPVIDRVVARVEASRAKGTTAKPTYNSPYPLAQNFYLQARERGYDIKFAVAAGVMQVFAMAPLSALSAVLMFYILLHLKVDAKQAVLLALLFAFATPVFYRTGQLNQNLLVAHSAFFAFAALWRPWDVSPRRPPRYLLAGLLSGWAVVLDYSGVVVPLVLGAYAFFRRRSLKTKLKSKTDMWRFAAGVGVCALILMAYQGSSFGHPLYPAQRYMPPTELSVYGYNGMDRPHLDLLWDTAFGTRFGLFTSAPLMLLVFWVPGWMKGRRLVGGLEAVCIVVFTILFFLFSASNQFGRLQFNTGVRYIVPVVPFLFLIVAGVLIQVPKVMATLIAVLSTYWSWCLAMYRDVELGTGVFESLKHITLEGFRLPWLTTLERMGYVPDHTSVIPLFVICGAVIWIIWSVGAQKKPATEVAH